MRCKVGLESGRQWHPAAFVAPKLNLADRGFLTEGLQRPADVLLVGDEDVGLIERHVECVLIRNFRPNETHLVGECLDVGPPSAMTSPFCMTSVGDRRPGLAAADDVGDAVFRIGPPKIGDALAGGRGVLQPVGAQPERAYSRSDHRPSTSLTPNWASYFLAAALASTPHQRGRYLQIRMMPTVPQI